MLEGLLAKFCLTAPTAWFQLRQQPIATQNLDDLRSCSFACCFAVGVICAVIGKNTVFFDRP